MEKAISPQPKRRWWFGMVILTSLLAIWSGHRIYKELTMPPPFVYLIPSDYFGPVVTFFGQADGVEMKPDPLGHAVDVPATGIVKVRSQRPDAMGVSREGYRASYFVAVHPDETRKILKYLTDVYREDGVWWQGVVDEKSTMTRYNIGPETKGEFDHLPEALRNERMIAARDGCNYRFEHADEASKETDCDEFLVISPNERMATLDWLWGDFGAYFESVAEFSAKIAEIQAKKAEYIRSQGEDKATN